MIMTSGHLGNYTTLTDVTKGKAGWAQPDLRPDGDQTHGAGAVKLGGTRAPRAWEEPDFSVEADAQRHQSPCSDRRPDGRRKNEMKNRQPRQSEAEAQLSSGSAIAASAITISFTCFSSKTASGARSHGGSRWAVMRD